MDNRQLLQKTGLTPLEFVEMVGHTPNRMTVYRWFAPGVTKPVVINLMLRYAVAFPAYVGWLREQKEKIK